jgi:AcrR family transcriptional regulator
MAVPYRPMADSDNLCHISLDAKCYPVSVTASPPTPPPGLRERKKARTRTELTDAALRQFTEAGFEQTTIEDIVGEVDVSPRTFFRYFDSKEDVVIGFYDDLGEELVDLVAERPADEPPFTALRRALESFATIYEERRTRVCAVSQLAYETAPIRARLLDKHARWENGLARALAQRMDVDPELDPRPRLIAAVSLAAFSTAAKAWAATGGSTDLAESVSANLEAVEGGLDRATPPD